jgi:NCS1 family nucleobase:cation symporter-1
LFNVSDSVGILIFASVIVVVTVLGYRVIHWIGRVASVIGVIAFVYLFWRLMSQPTLAHSCKSVISAGAAFLLAVSLAASWQIAFGPYVADYSRYLPSNTIGSQNLLRRGAGSPWSARKWR